MSAALRQDAKRLAAEVLLGAAPLPSGESPWAHDARARARTRLLDAGAPSRRDEYWRNTDPARLLVEGGPEAGPDLALPGRRVLMSDEFLRLETSDPLDLPGLSAAPLAHALHQDLSFARELFGRIEAAAQEKVARPLAALNTAAASQGLALHVTGPVPEPLHLTHRGMGETLTRHAIRIETGGALTLIETGLAANAVIEVDLAPGARFDHIRLQSGGRGAAHVFARVGAGAVFKSFTLTTDAVLIRNETVIDLAGEGARGHVAGATLGRGGSHADQTVFVTHSAPGCESRQVFKTVLADQAVAVFQGKIFVRQPAQKTDGYQITQAVLLDDGPQFLAKPELEIYADDVKCSHGSTTGALDETALFYLRARGVRRAEAEAMLVAAFTEQAVAEIAEPALAELVQDQIALWMAGR